MDCAKYNKLKDVDWMDLILEVLREENTPETRSDTQKYHFAVLFDHHRKLSNRLCKTLKFK